MTDAFRTFFYFFQGLLVIVSGFNLDIKTLVRHRGHPGSMFGFSVSQHSFQGQNWVIVGAPEDQTDQPGVKKGGAVYKCDTDRDDSCEIIPFDTRGDNRDGNSVAIDSKSNQWFGATVASANGSVLACAPRYIYMAASPEPRRDPVGTCYLARNQFTEFKEFSPCRTREWGYHRQGSCQAGLGAAVSKDGRRLYMGAPGSWYWQGQVHSVNPSARLPFVPPKVIIYHEGQISSQNAHSRPDVISSLEGPMSHDDTYLGYSVTSGYFTGSDKSGISDIAVGVPKGHGLLGKVVLFSYNMTLIQNITGEQLGSYFGYSLCSCDVDGDGFDDLVIGAPLYTDMMNHEGKYETGRIYVVYQGSQGVKFNSVHIRDGNKNSKARFGLALTSLGDINRDGYEDFAVGAPYDGKDERGVVYIYHGSANGVREKYSQIISNDDDIAGFPTTFGFSLAGGQDLDSNSYPDLVVGAYESDEAFLFKARPVVKVDASVTFEGEAKQISLDGRNCTLKDGTKAPCVRMVSCMKYQGIGVENRLDFEIQFALDAKKSKSPRMAFLSEEGRALINQTVRLDKGKQQCKSMYVYLKSNIRDKLTSLDAEMRYSLHPSMVRQSGSLAPVLDLNEELWRRDSLTIQKNCGTDNVCIPDLRLEATPSVPLYLLGSNEKLSIEVMVKNVGEDAFESTFEMKVPPGLAYVNIERLDDADKEVLVQCSAPNFLNNQTLRCDIGNPLPGEKLVRFLVILRPKQQDDMKPTYDFDMTVNSTNPEDGRTVTDNRHTVSVSIWVQTEVILEGSSQPAEINYNTSQYIVGEDQKISQETEIGPQVWHDYTIRNKGPSDFLEAEVVFLWPSYTASGEHLLSIMEQPETTGNIKCEKIDITVKDIKIFHVERKKKGDLEGKMGEASGLSSSISTSDSTSTSSTRKITKKLTVEERKKFMEEERRREEEEAKKDTGDGTDRQRSRVKNVQGSKHLTSNGGRIESDSQRREHEAKEVRINERGRTEITRVPQAGSSTYEQEMSKISSSSSSSATSSSSGSGQINREPSREGSRRGGHSFSEEHSSSSHTSWAPGSKPKTVVESSWKTEEDGVVRNGSNVRVVEGTLNLADLGLSTSGSSRRYGGGGGAYTEEKVVEKNSTWSSSDGGKNWKLEGEDWRHGSDGQVDSNRGGTLIISGGVKNRGGTKDGGTSRVSEERHKEWNTTWSSQGKPVTNEYTSWKKDKDGQVTSGSHSDSYEGSAKLDDNFNRRIVASGGSVSKGGHQIDENIIAGAGGGRTFKKEEEWERRYNTTWNSGGKPVTKTSSSWRVNEDGVVKSGSSSDVYEGTAPTITDESLPNGVRVTQTRIVKPQNIGGRRTGGKEINYGTRVVEEEKIETTYSNRRPHQSEGRDSESEISSASRDRTTWREDTSNRERQRSSSASQDTHQQGSGYSSSGQTGQRHQSGGYASISSNERDGYSSSSNRNQEGSRGTYTHQQNRGGSSSSDHKESGVYSSSSSSNRNQDSNRGTYSHHQQNRGGSSGSVHEENSGYSASNRNQQGRGGTYSHHQENGGSITSEQSGGRVAGTTNLADLLGTSKTNQGEFGMGAVARGPKDGVAKTYVADLGTYGGEKESSSSSGRGSVHYSSGGDRQDSSSRHHSKERHYSFGGEESKDSEAKITGGSSSSRSYSRGYSARANDEIDPDLGYVRPAGSHSSSSSKSYEFSSSSSGGTANGDDALHGGAYAGRSSSRDSENRRSSSGGRAYSTSYENSQSYSSSSDGSSSQTNINNPEEKTFRHYRRDKREVDYDSDKELNELTCSGPVECTAVKCKVGALRKDQEVTVQFRSRLWVKTIKKIAPNVEVALASEVMARVTKLPHIGTPSSSATPSYSAEVKSKVMPDKVTGRPDVVPLWIVLLSACAGTAILMLLVYGLYKCGFFKRNRPSNSPEKQPLNRNGHYNGDEAL